MTPGRRLAFRLACVAAGGALAVEVLEFALWPLPFGSLYLLAFAAAVAVPAVGAWLLFRGDERGVAVLAAGALIAVPQLSYDVIQLLWWTEPITPMEMTLAVLRVGESAALIAAGLLAWRHREEPLWSPVRRHPWPYAVVAIVTFTVGQLWPARVLVPPRALGDVPFLLQIVVLGIVLIAVTRVPRWLAGPALLTAIAPVLAMALFGVSQALSFGAMLDDVSGLIDVLGRLILVGIAIHWLRAERPTTQRIPAPEPT
jgi:hypothetical protein